ncbi:hypothetical protein QWZ14_31180 [Paeniroseomonas aquatica]|uniref:Uncharacterized protein n=1 Tax=Paeniroseomonas aquatica TaxID=373043 RepID=A0ABT8AGJ7_9PROT|nr:hypothetical protein [Paeniroseomonas aquatica]MDN3568864.1 hypothetical protein [Paeniroseomonas aquatica]
MAQAQGYQFRCPAPGTVVEQSTGSRLAYRGPDANDPMVCTMANGERRAFGYWAAGSPFYRSGRTQLARLVSGSVGPASKEERLDYFSLGRDSNSVHFYEAWRVAGTGPVQVVAGTFDTLRLERRVQIQNTAFSYTETVWLDRASGAPVKVQVDHLNGFMAPSLTSWEATEVRTRTTG